MRVRNLAFGYYTNDHQEGLMDFEQKILSYLCHDGVCVAVLSHHADKRTG